MTSSLRSVALVAVACLVLAGCGKSDSGTVASTRGGAATSTSDTTATTDATGSGTGSSASVGPGSTVKAGGGTATTARPGTTPTTSPAPPTTTTTRPAPAGASGVRGVVTAGPQCPVQREGDHSCDDKPVPAHLTLQRGDGSTAASADAGADGQFFITAGAGNYTLAATSPNAMRCTSQPITVTAGHVTDVQVSCDTGIR